MEYCMKARALKSSFLSEAAMKSTQQVYPDDLWCVTGINNVSSDDFSVDDLLDFSDKDFNEALLEESEEYEEKDCSLSVSSHNKRVVYDDDYSSNSITSTGSGVFESLSDGDLAVPVDEMENLEWLSRFVDDSASGMTLLCPAGNCKEKTGNNFDVNRSEPEAKKFTVLGLPYPVRTKARSKRSRPSGRIWSLGSLLLTESLSSSSLSSSQDSSITSPFMPMNPVHVMDSFATFQKPPLKKQKRNPAGETGSQSQPLRRCSHCLVQKTPQWRSGPLGPKTLCNACGVRFKSGRLFPEYRPACSPTFAGDIHSNTHRKVLEMRRKKETAEFVMTGLTQMVGLA